MSLATVPEKSAARALHVSRPVPLVVNACLAAGDLTAVALAGLVSYQIRTRFGALDPAPYYQLAPLVFAVPAVYFYKGLYPGYGLNPVEQLRRTSRSTTAVFVFIMALTYLFKVGTIHSRLVVTGAWLGAMVVVPLIRALLRALLSKTSWWGTPLVVLGAAKTAEVVIKRLRSQPGLGLVPVACLDDDPHKQGGTVGGIQVIGPLRLAPEIANNYGVRMAIVAMPGLTRERLTRVLEEHASVFPHVLIIPDLLGLTSLWVSARDLQGVLGLELQQNLLSRWSGFLKRTTDLVVSVPTLLVVGPIILLLVLLVKLNSPGPAFYNQEREGLNGKRIRVWKLRTMVPNAEKVLQGYLAQNPEAKQEWDQYMKLRNDPRIVPMVGHMLRRLSLDELPQLWNIVCGDMSLVGPRPFPDYHLNRFPPAFRALRCKVVPGLTGLWQVSARSDGDLAIQEELDTYYIRNWSLWMDFYLLARTVTAVLFGKGAY